MMTIKDFTPSEDNTRFEGVINNFAVEIMEDRLSEEIVQYAEKIVNLFLEKKEEVFDYLLKNGLTEFYYSYNDKEIIEKLNEPIFKIWDNSGQITWLNHDLDEHIIDLEFKGDLELSSVSIDG